MMGAENINRRRYIMAVRGINKVILVGGAPLKRGVLWSVA